MTGLKAPALDIRARTATKVWLQREKCKRDTSGSKNQMFCCSASQNIVWLNHLAALTLAQTHHSAFSPSPPSFLLSSQGTVNNQTGIFPQSFVKIIKPLPNGSTEGEDEGHTYSCLRCFLLGPSGIDARWVGSIFKSAVVGLQLNPRFDGFVWVFLQRCLRRRRSNYTADIQRPSDSHEVCAKTWDVKSSVGSSEASGF